MKKKFDFKVFIGFPVGIMMLVISYIFIYLIDGNNVYIFEISKLENINILVGQIIQSGILYTVFIIWIKSCLNIIVNKKGSKFTYKDLGIFLIECTIVAIISFVFCGWSKKYYSEELQDVTFGLGIVVMMLVFAIYFIVNVINIHFINKKIRQRNKNT